MVEGGYKVGGGSQWGGVTLAQMLAALTMGKRASALGRTVTSSPGNRPRSFASYFSAGPTVSTNTLGGVGVGVGGAQTM